MTPHGVTFSFLMLEVQFADSTIVSCTIPCRWKSSGPEPSPVLRVILGIWPINAENNTLIFCAYTFFAAGAGTSGSGERAHNRAIALPMTGARNFSPFQGGTRPSPPTKRPSASSIGESENGLRDLVIPCVFSTLGSLAFGIRVIKKQESRKYRFVWAWWFCRPLWL